MADFAPIKTYGLTHVALPVADPQASFRFYERLLGAKLVDRLAGREADDLSAEDWIEFGIPGAHDVIVLSRAKGEVTGNTGELEHFGFRLQSKDDPETLASAVEAAGGTVLGSGRFKGGEPFCFARDPDGYEIELWFQDEDEWRAES